MEVHDFFLHLIIILMSARILGELAAHIGVPSVIGEIMAGVILGPSLLGFIEPYDMLKAIGSIDRGVLTVDISLPALGIWKGEHEESWAGAGNIEFQVVKGIIIQFDTIGANTFRGW